MTILAQARPSDRAWLYLILVFIALNAVDLGMTYRLVDLGAVELNPIMAAALNAGWMWAIGLKGIDHDWRRRRVVVRSTAPPRASGRCGIRRSLCVAGAVPARQHSGHLIDRIQEGAPIA